MPASGSYLQGSLDMLLPLDVSKVSDGQGGWGIFLNFLRLIFRGWYFPPKVADQQMLAKVITCAVVGLEGAIVEVEVDISPGLPVFTIVGLPDTAVQEARERVRAAIRNSGCAFPMKRIVVNLAPAHLKKAGPAYDLPIAVGILLSSEQVSADVSQTILLGELSLDGSLRHTNGILPMVALAHQEKISTLIVPDIDAREASLIEGTEIIP
ncbi:unnamed protein product, partial [marine sediment metagenome]